MLSRSLLSLLVTIPFVAAIKNLQKSDIRAKQAEALKLWQAHAPPTSSNTRTGINNITFSNPKASGECLFYRRLHDLY